MYYTYCFGRPSFEELPCGKRPRRTPRKHRLIGMHLYYVLHELANRRSMRDG